jgi:hypothetical protein
MSREDIQEMLIDYADGTIDESRKIIIESELKRSPELSQELQLIKDTFIRLDKIEESDVPTHYFSNFLPRLNEKLQNKKTTIELLYPAWLRMMAVPTVALVIIAGIIGMYLILQPPNYKSSLYSAMQAVEQERSEEDFKDNLLLSPAGTISSDIESIIQSEEIVSNVDAKMIAREFFNESLIFDNLTNDNQILNQLSDDDLIWIADNLNHDRVN